MGAQRKMIAVTTILASTLALGPVGVSAQPGPHQMAPPPAMNILCPNPATLRMVPVGTPAWSTNPAPVHVTLDPLNPPRVESNTMICYYALGNQPGSYVLFRPTNGKPCSATSDQKGFVCTKW